MLTLYEHPFALYCQKVLVALNEQGVAYDVLEEQRDLDRAELGALWPPASIPVLRDGDQIIGETSIIIEHVAGSQMVPSLEARKWDRLCDQYISDAVQAIVSDTIEGRFDERAVRQALRRRAGPFLRPGDPPLGWRHTPGADALLPGPGPSAVLLQGDRRRAALPAPLPAALAGRLRPLPLTSRSAERNR